VKSGNDPVVLKSEGKTGVLNRISITFSRLVMALIAASRFKAELLPEWGSCQTFLIGRRLRVYREAVRHCVAGKLARLFFPLRRLTVCTADSWRERSFVRVSSAISDAATSPFRLKTPTRGELITTKAPLRRIRRRATTKTPNDPISSYGTRSKLTMNDSVTFVF
jgi:hypothetical protein